MVSEKTVAVIIAIIMIAIVFLFVGRTVIDTLEKTLHTQAKKSYFIFQNVLRKANENGMGVNSEGIKIDPPGYFIAFFNVTNDIEQFLLEYSNASRFRGDSVGVRIEGIDNVINCQKGKPCMCLILIHKPGESITPNRYAVYTSGYKMSLDRDFYDREFFDNISYIWSNVTEFFYNSVLKQVEIPSSLNPNQNNKLKFVSCSPMSNFCTCNKCSFINSETECNSLRPQCQTTKGCLGVESASPGAGATESDKECAKYSKFETCPRPSCSWEFSFCTINTSYTDLDNVTASCPILIQDTVIRPVVSISSPIYFKFLSMIREFGSCNYIFDRAANEVLVGVNRNVTVGGDDFTKQGSHQACVRQVDITEERAEPCIGVCRGEQCQSGLRLIW